MQLSGSAVSFFAALLACPNNLCFLRVEYAFQRRFCAGFIPDVTSRISDCCSRIASLLCPPQLHFLPPFLLHFLMEIRIKELIQLALFIQPVILRDVFVPEF